MSKEMDLFGSAPGPTEWDFDPENEAAWPDLWTPEFQPPWPAPPANADAVRLTSEEAMQHRDAAQAAQNAHGRLVSEQGTDVTSLSRSSGLPFSFNMPQGRAWDSP